MAYKEKLKEGFVRIAIIVDNEPTNIRQIPVKAADTVFSKPKNERAGNLAKFSVVEGGDRLKSISKAAKGADLLNTSQRIATLEKTVLDLQAIVEELVQTLTKPAEKPKPAKK